MKRFRVLRSGQEMDYLEYLKITIDINSILQKYFIKAVILTENLPEKADVVLLLVNSEELSKDCLVEINNRGFKWETTKDSFGYNVVNLLFK